MTICLVENLSSKHNAYFLALKEAFPGARIVPDFDQPCDSWKTALALIKALPRDGEHVFVLDLLLTGDSSSDADPAAGADEGLRNARYIRQEFPSAVMICISTWGHNVLQKQNPFDEVLDLQVPANKDVDRVSARLVMTIRRHLKTGASGAAQDVAYEDSYAFRLAEAALGSERLRKFFPAVASGWKDVAVTALSHGASGAFLFKLSGQCNGRPSALVYKIARDRQLLQEEIEAFRQAQPHLGHFAGRFNSSGFEIEVEAELPFYTQSLVPGKSLYAVFRDGGAAKCRPVLENVTRLLTQQYEWALEEKNHVGRPLASEFDLGPVRVQFLLHACDRLEPVAEFLRKRGRWPKGHPKPAEVFSDVRDLVKTWTNALALPAPYWVYQHGDLHGGNIIAVDTPVFIDPPRLRLWPVGYDMCRLATHAQVLLTGPANDEDWVDGDIASWAKSPFADLDQDSIGGDNGWPAQIHRSFLRFARAQRRSHAELRRVYEFCALSDLLRMINYPTLSHSKRIWVALGCSELKRRMKL